MISLKGIKIQYDEDDVKLDVEVEGDLITVTPPHGNGFLFRRSKREVAMKVLHHAQLAVESALQARDQVSAIYADQNRMDKSKEIN